MFTQNNYYMKKNTELILNIESTQDLDSLLNIILPENFKYVRIEKKTLIF